MEYFSHEGKIKRYVKTQGHAQRCGVTEILNRTSMINHKLARYDLPPP
jgi:hypothetical protein